MPDTKEICDNVVNDILEEIEKIVISEIEEPIKNSVVNLEPIKNLVVNLEQENITDLINRALEEDIVKLNYKLIKSII